MQDLIRDSGPEAGGYARLVGGPADLPEGARTRPGGASGEGADKIKVAHHGGYEHFERAAGAGDPGRDGSAEVQFHWTMRTEAAE